MTGRGFRLGALERPQEGRMFAGVCAGISQEFALDVTLVRLAFLFLLLAKGVGLIAYLGLWILLPENGASAHGLRLRDVARLNARGIRGELPGLRRRMRESWDRTSRDPWPYPLGRRWIGLTLVVLGTFLLGASVGFFSWLTPMRVLGVCALVAGAAVLFRMGRGAS